VSAHSVSVIFGGGASSENIRANNLRVCALIAAAPSRNNLFFARFYGLFVVNGANTTALQVGH
jgi:hypothetical protein